MPAARRIARPSVANGEPAPSESPMPNSTSPRAGWRCTHSTNSWRRRDLPTPAAPTTSTADAIDSASVPAYRFVSIDISRPRPTKSVALPSRLRLTSNMSRSPRRNGAVPSRRISKRVSSSPTATSSRRIAPGAVPRSRRMPLSITSPATDHAENRPGPVDTTSGTSGRTARIASAQRAARAA